MRIFIRTAIFVFVCSHHLYVWAESLCTPTETVFFNCKVAGSGKLLSICGSLKAKKFLQYRFGTQEKIELAFPKKDSESFSKFSLATDYRKTAGTTALELSFSVASYKYVVSATSYPLSEGPNPKFSKFGGVSVSSSAGKTSEISCTGEPNERLEMLEGHVEHE